MNKISKISFYLFYLIYLLISFLVLDFFFGNSINKIILKKNKILPQTEYTEKNSIYHHELLKNYNQEVIYSNFRFKLCTDENGFRINCEKKYKKKDKDLGNVFIGDSTTEGTGVNFENTFFGIIEDKKNEKILTNISSASYSFSIYFAKLNHLLNNKKFNIKKVILIPDISDINDEAKIYNLNDYNIVETLKSKANFSDLNQKKIDKKNYKYLLSKKLPITYAVLRNIYYYDLPRPIYRYKRNYARAEWTYNVESTGYGELGVDGSIKKSLIIMNKIYRLLDEKNVKLSIIILPQPVQILYDTENSLHAKIFDDFCRNKCEEFLNLYPIFFEKKKTMSDKSIINKYFLKGDMHFNEEGHKIISDEIIRKINLYD